MKPTPHLLLALFLFATPISVANAKTFYRCVTTAAAATPPIRWQALAAGERLAMGYSPTSFPEPWLTELQSAVSAWNQNPSTFRFALEADDTVAIQNGENEIWFTAGLGTRGVTSLRWDCDPSKGTGALTEADIRFNSDMPFTTSTSKADLLAYDGGSRHFAAVAVHELGHALGLDHTWYTYSVMGEPETHVLLQGNEVVAYAGEDTSDGAVDLYGLGSGEDLSVTHWHHGYTGVQRNWLVRSTGQSLTLATGAGQEPIYGIEAGAALDVQVTFENSGASTASVKIGFFVSTNATITTMDTLLLPLETITLTRDTVDTLTRSVVLPSGLTTGTTQYLGVIVDAEDQVAEADETNNSIHLAALRIEAVIDEDQGLDPEILDDPYLDPEWPLQPQDFDLD